MLTTTQLVSVLVLGLLIYKVANVVYNITLHPLGRFPGPKLWSITPLAKLYYFIQGRLDHVLIDLHSAYGPVVRIAPDELSFIGPSTSWRDIYGLGSDKRSRSQVPKDRTFYETALPPQGWSIFYAPNDIHAQLRGHLAKAFSEKALRDQELFLKRYTDLFVDRLSNTAATGEAVDVTRWFNYLTFDLVGDLAFGESFGCLTESRMHDWVALIFQSVRVTPVLFLASAYPSTVGLLLNLLAPRRLLEARDQHWSFSKDKITRRTARGADRSRRDFFSYILKDDDKHTPQAANETPVSKGRKAADLLDCANLTTNAYALILAGSETTATALSGTTHFLVNAPSALATVTSEVRNAFSTKEEITFAATSALAYLNACISETLRLYPPVPAGLPRRTTVDTPIGGIVVPKNTAVSIPHLATYTSPLNFSYPTQFRPERWLPNHRLSSADPLLDTDNTALEDAALLAADNREVFNPFSFGPRNCLGKSLAWAEMRYVLARTLWHFDLKGVEEAKVPYDEEVLVSNCDNVQRDPNKKGEKKANFDEAYGKGLGRGWGQSKGPQGDWYQRQKTFLLWEKDPLFVRLKQAKA